MQRPFRVLLLLALLCAALAACGGGTGTTTATPTAKGTSTTSFGMPSTSFQLSGLVKNSGMFALSDLQAFPNRGGNTIVQVSVSPVACLSMIVRMYCPHGSKSHRLCECATTWRSQ